MTRLGINGLGRVGRLLVRCLRIAPMRDIACRWLHVTSLRTATIAHLLK